MFFSNAGDHGRGRKGFREGLSPQWLGGPVRGNSLYRSTRGGLGASSVWHEHSVAEPARVAAQFSGERSGGPAQRRSRNHPTKRHSPGPQDRTIPTVPARGADQGRGTSEPTLNAGAWVDLILAME